MKIRIKLDLHVLKEYFIATSCEKNVRWGDVSKSSEMLVKCERGRSPNSQINTCMTTFSMKDCLTLLAHRTDKCIGFGLWNVVPFLN